MKPRPQPYNTSYIIYFSIVIDVRVSIVTVSKLVDANVSGNCVCPSGSSGTFESIEKARTVSNTSSVICDPFVSMKMQKFTKHQINLI